MKKKDIGKLLQEYFSFRKKMGFKLEKHIRPLEEFVELFNNKKTSILTNELSLEFAKLPTGCDPAWWTERLGMLRSFARYWKNYDSRIQIPPSNLLPGEYKRPNPYIYSTKEISNILKAINEIKTINKNVYLLIIGLLIVTGARVGEILALNITDVDLNAGTIVIKQGKSNRSRIIPVHPSTIKALSQYLLERGKKLPANQDSPFFINKDKRRVTHAAIWKIFNSALVRLNLREIKQSKGPRIHDLRHTFSVNSIINFYNNGTNIENNIYALSVYLGHKSLRCTYYYLTAVPRLMSIALDKVNQKLENCNEK